MLYLPTKVWDTRNVAKDGGCYIIFRTGDDWHGLQIFSDGRPPILHHFPTPPELATFGDYLPEAAVEVRAEDYRVHLFEDGRIAVTRILCGER